jgi:hypothetical protein
LSQSGERPKRYVEFLPLPVTSLLLKRASASRSSGEWSESDYDVLADGVVIGRIMRAAAALEGMPWIWTLIFGYHEDRSPTHGPRARPRWRRSRRAGGASKRAPGIIPRAQRGNKAPLPMRGQQTVVGSFEQGGLDGAGIYFLWGSYWFWVRRRRHASNRANPGRHDVLLSSLRSTLFGDVLAAFQE